MRFAKVDATASGSNEIVAAIAGKRIRVVGYSVVASGSVSITWQSAGTAISGAMALAANGAVASAVSTLAPGGVFGVLQTEPGEALNLDMDSATAVGGHLVYVEVLT